MASLQLNVRPAICSYAFSLYALGRYPRLSGLGNSDRFWCSSIVNKPDGNGSSRFFIGTKMYSRAGLSEELLCARFQIINNAQNRTKS
ncbi:hypothetical protein QWY86_01490 [Pedobacter aquatilis]|uniref:hypothetical protein n=1 Tax=Pedobacter aquatilis TaxID=351343 RepID=UPI0025B4472C|nr:hypothetical protein [Pedobacter aquatilis]MDN3585324.1 hypothetical protein [Pedobacter aquatilis]